MQHRGLLNLVIKQAIYLCQSGLYKLYSIASINFAQRSVNRSVSHAYFFARVGTLLHGTDHPAMTSGVFTSGTNSKLRYFIRAGMSFARCPCLRYCSL